MGISLIISGTLTGFSRFYATPNANEVYNEAKIDFDYRNLVTFLREKDEKVYALSFSPKVVSISLVTRILDSFRRPGILVVTVLLPRYQNISNQANSQDKTAIFKLLNEVNDKFYEKNFLNGMVNQNPAVLMQDYYSDILSRYVFVNDRMQKPINSRIDVTSPNKRIGYVAASESSMPKYLSSVMRKSYEGYHHVFISPHAPQNIDEPAEEVLTYKVRIENGNHPVPGEVRLTDRIPNINPEQGERDIPNKDFTYSQVISGDAGMDIVGNIENGDTIVLTYRFPKEEKTVHFKFYEGANEVPIALIHPMLFEANGTSFNISSESITFSGKEIYGRKTIKSGNSDYTIEGTSSNVDLLRVQNGGTLNIYVQHGWEIRYQFNGSFIIPKHIILTNKFTRERKEYDNITTSLADTLTGRPNDWELEIYSDKYEPIRVPYGVDIKPVPKREVNNTLGYQAYNRRTNVNSISNRSQISTNPNNQGLKISHGENPTAKDAEQIRHEKNIRYMTYGMTFVIAVLLVFGGIWGYKVLFGEAREKEEVETDTTLVTKNVKFSLVNGSISTKIEDENIKLLSLTITSNGSNGVKVIDTDSDFEKNITYNPSNQNDSIIAKVTFQKSNDSAEIIFAFSRFAVNDLKDGINPVILSVENSELTSYRELKDGKLPDIDKLVSQITRLSYGDEHMRDYAKILIAMRDDLLKKERIAKEAEAKKKAKEAAKKKAEAEAKKKAETEVAREGESESEEIRAGFNALSLTLSKDQNYLLSNNKKLNPKNEAERERNNALISVLKELNKGDIPSSTPMSLSTQQQKIINDLRRIRDRKKNDTNAKSRLRSDLKKWKSLSEIKANIIDKQ